MGMPVVDNALKIARGMRAGGGRVNLHTGPIHAAVAGRTDHLPMHVPQAAYVLPADIVSAMGEGNTLSGFKVAAKLPKSMFSVGNRTGGSAYGQTGGAYRQGSDPYAQPGLPYGAPPPGRASGGTAGAVPIVAAGGEYVFTPEECAMIAPDGNPDTGHKILDEFVKQYRATTVKKLEGLPGPKKN